MKFGTLALLALGTWFAVLWVRKKTKAVQADRLPAGVQPLDPHVRTHATGHYDACTQALKTFASEYRLSFQHGKCSRATVMSLNNIRNEALRHMYQMRMRLPNDLDAETRLTQQIEETDRIMRAYIQDAQDRCGARLAFAGPVDDMFYKQLFRAHNDS